jgi:hypothetical protein
VSNPSSSERTRFQPTHEEVLEYIRTAWETSFSVPPPVVPTSTEYAIAQHALAELLTLRNRLGEAA